MKIRVIESGPMRNVLMTAAILRGGLTVWAFASTGTQVMTQGDTASYIVPGLSLLQHGAFANAGIAEIDRTPGYPAFAVLSGMWGNHVLLTVAFQIVLSLLSLLLVRRIADLVFPVSRPGIAAAWMFAVEPISIVYSVRLMPETLFVFLLLVVLERVIVFQSSGRLGAVAMAACFIVTATFVRPVSYYLLPAFAIGLLFTGPRRGLHWKASLLFLVIALACIGAWRFRNLKVTGYEGFSSVVDKNLYFYQAAGVSARLSHESLAKVQERLGYSDDGSYLIAHPGQVEWSRAERLRYMRKQGIAVLLQHPFLAVESQLEGSLIVAFTPCTMELLQLVKLAPTSAQMPHRVLTAGVIKSGWAIVASHPLIAAVMLLSETYLVALYLFAFWGVLKVASIRGPLITLIAVALYFLLISGGAQAVGRYRLPVMPELCVLAAAGLVRTQAKRRSHVGPAIDVDLQHVRS